MTNVYRFGRFDLNPATRQLLVEEQPVPLGNRAFDVLLALVERRDRLVPKDELLALVWPRLVVEDNNLQVQISTLRKLLGREAIATAPGRGYRFTLELEDKTRASSSGANANASVSASQRVSGERASEVLTHFEKAFDAIEDKHWMIARKEVRAILSIDPGNSKAFATLNEIQKLERSALASEDLATAKLAVRNGAVRQWSAASLITSALIAWAGVWELLVDARGPWTPDRLLGLYFLVHAIASAYLFWRRQQFLALSHGPWLLTRYVALTAFATYWMVARFFYHDVYVGSITTALFVAGIYSLLAAACEWQARVRIPEADI